MNCEEFKTKWIVRCEKYNQTLSTHPVLSLRNATSPASEWYHVCSDLPLFLLRLIHKLLAADPLLNGPIWRNEYSFVAFNVLKPFCFSENLINRVQALNLETYWIDSATLCCMRFLFQFVQRLLDFIITTKHPILPDSTSLHAYQISRMIDLHYTLSTCTALV